MGVFKRKNKNGEEGETWYVDYRDPTGKRIIKAIGPKRDAEAHLGKVKAAIREGRFFDMKKENKTTFKKLLDSYIEKAKEQKYYKTSIQFFIPVLEERFGEKLLSEIDYKGLEDFRDKRKKTPTQHGTPRSERTVDLEMAILRHIFRKGLKWKMLDRSPFENAEDLFYRKRNKRERALSEDEVRRLIDACPPRLKPIIITAVYTGLRKTDVLTLKWKNVDLERGLIRLVEEKTGKTRNIVLNKDIITLLQNLPVKGEYLFPNRNGNPFHDVKKSLEKALKKAGIKQSQDRREKIVFHTLRHTCISLLTEKGADTTAVKNYVAHADEKMTAHYTHLSEEYARRTSDLLNGLCGVNLLFGNNLETTGKNAKKAQNASFADA
jgi:integrase